MTSPICLVNGLATTNGVDVSTSSTVTIQLADTAGVNTWEITCIGTDELTTPATINATLTITDVINKTAQFTMSSYDGSAVILQSRVNLGRDVNGKVINSYTTTFKVATVVHTNRVIALNETLENNASFGWIGPINQALRTMLTSGEDLIGDVNGLIHTNTVDKIKNTNLAESIKTIGATQDGYSLTWINGSSEWQPKLITAIGTAGGDLSGSYPNPTVSGINTYTVVGTPSSTGQALRYTTGTALGWGAIDLANSNAVTGVLPIGNQASQNMVGDVSGTTAASVVDKLKGKTLNSSLSSIGATQDGYVLTWVDGSSDWEAKPTGTLITLAGDVTGTVGSNTVEKIRNKTLAASLASIGATQDGYVLSWNNSANEWQANSNFATTVITLSGNVTGASNNNVVTTITGSIHGGDGYYKTILGTPSNGLYLAGDQHVYNGFGTPTINIVGASTTSSNDGGFIYMSGGLSTGGGHGGNIHIGSINSGSAYPDTFSIAVAANNLVQLTSYGDVYIRADQSSAPLGTGPGKVVFESPVVLTGASAGAADALPATPVGYLKVGIWSGGDGGTINTRYIPFY